MFACLNVDVYVQYSIWSLWVPQSLGVKLHRPAQTTLERKLAKLTIIIDVYSVISVLTVI